VNEKTRFRNGVIYEATPVRLPVQVNRHHEPIPAQPGPCSRRERRRKRHVFFAKRSQKTALALSQTPFCSQKRTQTNPFDFTLFHGVRLVETVVPAERRVARSSQAGPWTQRPYKLCRDSHLGRVARSSEAGPWAHGSYKLCRDSHLDTSLAPGCHAEAEGAGMCKGAPHSSSIARVVSFPEAQGPP